MPKRVTSDDCDTWADRVVTITRHEAEEGDKRCTLKPSAEALVDLEKEYAALRDEVATSCRGLVGRPYAPRDAQCLGGATKADDLRTCAFATSFFPELVEGAMAARRVADTRCKLATRATPKPEVDAKAEPKKPDDSVKKKPDEDLNMLPNPAPTHSTSAKPEPSVAKKDPKGKKKP